MGTSTETRSIVAARKARRCDWCGEAIEVGSPYKRWRWFSHGDAGTVCAHVECKDAIDEAAQDEGGTIEFGLYENERPAADQKGETT